MAVGAGTTALLTICLHQYTGSFTIPVPRRRLARRMFCGNLGNEVDDTVLARVFNKYPSFNKAKARIRERGGKGGGGEERAGDGEGEGGGEGGRKGGREREGGSERDTLTVPFVRGERGERESEQAASSLSP